MVIVRAGEKGKEILMIGLSDENVKRLTTDQPIIIDNAKSKGAIPPGLEVVIFHGKSEQDIYRMLKKHGMIGVDTKIEFDPKLGNVDE